MKHTVTLIPGDGIGPEVINATRRILEAANVSIDWEVCEAGSKSFEKGIMTGVPEETIESIKRNKVALKGPLETPVGYGGKSANVTLRKLFDTFGNIRPIKTMPGISGPYQNHNIDMIIVRENVEDLYTGIEYMQTPDVAQTLKLISRWGCENISHLAFSLARSQGRKKVTCATKANIMKLSEGMMKRVFETVSELYPDIEAEHMIVDNCAHQMVMNPEQFDVVVMTNMNGDILSDLGSGLVGGLGIAPGANYGTEASIFEAVHGSAPTLAGQDRANPTAVLTSALMMLRHLGELESADLIENALYVTLADGKNLTEDLSHAKQAASTTNFTQQIINNLGKTHPNFQKRRYASLELKTSKFLESSNTYETIGLDIFIRSTESIETIGETLSKVAELSGFSLKMIANRGVQVYPDIGGVSVDLPPHHQCRFVSNDKPASEKKLEYLIEHVSQVYPWVQIERLYSTQEGIAFSKVQGEN